MVRHIFFPMLLLMAMAILRGSTEDCVDTGYYCENDAACCPGNICVQNESGQYCDCAPYGNKCDWLPCCFENGKEGICYGSKHCGVDCSGKDGPCDGKAFCCDDYNCGGTNEEAAHCV